MVSPLPAKARLLRSYHEDGPVLVLPNAWDALSAAVMVHAGARAIATTSAGVSWTRGRPDGERLSRAEMIDAIGRISAAVTVPVTADIEAGYGLTPAEIAATVTSVIGAGAVGINLEDAPGTGAPLREPHAQAERIRAARAAAVTAGLPELVINARTDVFLRRVGPPERRLADTLARASAYAEAGADCLFVPLLLDLDALATLVSSAPLWINAMAVPGGPSVADFTRAGVRRVSVGAAITQAAYTAAAQATRELLEDGTYARCAAGFSAGELDALVAGPR